MTDPRPRPIYFSSREKLFTALDNFDKPIPDSTAKRMAVSMVDCLHAQVLKGSPSVGETPEAIEAERLVSKQIEEVRPSPIWLSRRPEY